MTSTNYILGLIQVYAYCQNTNIINKSVTPHAMAVLILFDLFQRSSNSTRTALSSSEWIALTSIFCNLLFNGRLMMIVKTWTPAK